MHRVNRIILGCFGVIFCNSLSAGTLSCSITTAAACTGGTNVVVLRMSGSDNAHAELASQSNGSYASNVVCCSGVTGMTTTCSGTYEKFAGLSGVTNAHTEIGTQTLYTNPACLQVPNGGSVSVGFITSGSCTPTYDTTLASLSATTTNAHIGGPTAYANKICATAQGGTLQINIVDSGGTPVGSPSVAMSATSLSLLYQSTSGTLGISSEKIRVTNTTGVAAWAASIAATNNPTSLWSAGTPKYDFNDPTSNAVDGGDDDSYGGRMTINPAVSTITPQGGCDDTGLSKGSSSSFSEGVTDSITLVSAGNTASTGCYWDFTGISLSQTIPKEQSVASYSIDMTLTIVAA